MPPVYAYGSLPEFGRTWCLPWEW